MNRHTYFPPGLHSALCAALAASSSEGKPITERKTTTKPVPSVESRQVRRAMERRAKKAILSHRSKR